MPREWRCIWARWKKVESEDELNYQFGSTWSQQVQSPTLDIRLGPLEIQTSEVKAAKDNKFHHLDNPTTKDYKK